MQTEDLENLPDYLEPADVWRLSEQVLQESTQESVSATLRKLNVLADQQWHGYEPAPRDLRERLTRWLVQNWQSGSEEYLEAVLGLTYCYGLDKRIYREALCAYHGPFRKEFERNLERSVGENIDPWWSLRPAAE
ncbi:MAG TPA: hypothetical protein VFB96_12825 [Pirellulaceae bacterium]|nr:hypothetical protein [Pirellulaceae bacterium]